MREAIRFRGSYEPEINSISLIVSELLRIERDRIHYRHRNSKGMMYTCVIKVTEDGRINGHIAGPDQEISPYEPLGVKFIAFENNLGEPQISLGPKDSRTSREQAMFLAKHALCKILSKLGELPYPDDQEFDRSKWSGYYVQYSGNTGIFDTFDEHFDDAISGGVFPSNFKDTCLNFGFNIISC